MVTYTTKRKNCIQKDNLLQIARMTKRSSGRYFHLFFPDGSEADKTMGNTYFSSDIVDQIIHKEEILPQISRLDSANRTYDKPNWKRIHSLIKSKYGELYAERNVLKGKLHCMIWREVWV